MFLFRRAIVYSSRGRKFGDLVPHSREIVEEAWNALQQVQSPAVILGQKQLLPVQQLEFEGPLLYSYD